MPQKAVQHTSDFYTPYPISGSIKRPRTRSGSLDVEGKLSPSNCRLKHAVEGNALLLILALAQLLISHGSFRSKFNCCNKTASVFRLFIRVLCAHGFSGNFLGHVDPKPLGDDGQKSGERCW
jgi:hypothetical protein